MAGILVLVMSGLPVIRSFPSYRLKIPNGLRIQCPDGAAGCQEGDVDAGEPAQVCHGVGHATCHGATMPLNPFGIALEAENFTWTTNLCEADSDGDGLTNGEELGDPCCLWEEEYDTPSEYMLTFGATHPGVKNSGSEQYVRPACESTAPKSKAPKMNEFNPWEEQRAVDVYIDNYQIPAERTTYVDFALNFPDDSADVFHVVNAQTILKNAKNLHHYVIRGCPNKWPASRVGKPVSPEEARSCTQQFGGWAPGKQIISTPAWIGRPIGKAAGIVAFSVQVHYDNPTVETGRVSNDGIRIYYTPTLRNFTASRLVSTMISRNPSMFVEPGKERFFITRSCKINVKSAEGQPAKLHLASMSYHAHLLGTEMYSELTQGGRSIDLGSEKVWHFDDQYERNVLPMDVTLQTGDHLQTTCVYNSKQKTEAVIFGEETTDEMCWATYMGWPSNVVATCEGHVWAGELIPGEMGLGLALRHPENAAQIVWDGSNVVTGGSILKGVSTSGTCRDSHTMQDRCPMMAQLIQSPSQCTADFGARTKALAGSTILSLCCTLACQNQHCKDHALCGAQGTTSTTITSTTTTTTASDGTDVATGGASGTIGRSLLSSCSFLLLLGSSFS